MAGTPHHHTVDLWALPTERLAAALRRTGGNMAQVARAMGCSTQTILNRVKKDPALVRLVEQLRNAADSQING